jgi:hypothetical protein
MAAKKSIESVRAELREINAVADEVGAGSGSDWSTPEFWTMVVSGIANLVTVAVMFGWISSSDAESLTKALSALLGAAQVIIVNGLLVWKYITSRVAVREALIDARFRYMEAVAVERLRADRDA